MEFKGRLNLKFYIVSVMLLIITIIGWYGVFFLNTNEILMEDNLPMDSQTKMVFSIAESLIVISWTLSLFTILRQIVKGKAFSIDKEGVHSTSSAVIILAFIFVVPIKKIPYSAIEKITKEEGILTLYLDKSKVEINPLLRVFTRNKYRLFYGFTKETQEIVEKELKKYMDIK